MENKIKFPKALKLGPTGATHSASALFTDSRKSYPHPNSFCVFSPDKPPHPPPPLPPQIYTPRVDILEINKSNW